MAADLLPDQLWQLIEPLLPRHRSQPKGGHPFSDDRLCLRGIIFVLRSGVSWQLLPTEAFGVSGSTCWRRLRDWQRAGVWARIHKLLVQVLGKLGKLDLRHAIVDAQVVRAVFGGHILDRTRSIDGKMAANAMC
jgi:transposase